ncbi:MAG: hypothetical protein K6U10_06910 [Acidobacteriia bacterium]|nr:hypothetical protein [Methyloceanibacter sp.]MBX5472930.1 hypothetical protein [Acetobacteraceae bacterium]MCL6491534.1 hypothetical protein [Terriglobia bacterium]
MDRTTLKRLGAAAIVVLAVLFVSAGGASAQPKGPNEASPLGILPRDDADIGASQPTPAQLCRAGKRFFCSNLTFSVAQGPRNHRTLVVQGQIGEGDYQRFRQALAEAGPIDDIVLNSPGGYLDEGLAIGRFIRGRRLTTRIPNGFLCISACNFIFMGGVVRYVDPGGKFAAHMFTASGSKTFVQDVLAEAQTRGLEATIRDIEQESAETAAKVARFLVEMSVSLRFLTEFAAIPNDHPRVLSIDELREYNIVNTD